MNRFTFLDGRLQKVAATMGAALMLGLASAPAHAIPMSIVGEVDTLIGSASLSNSSEETESSWASGLLGYTVEFDGRTTCPKVGCAWQPVTGSAFSDVYAFDLLDDPGFFLVKTGAGSASGSTHFLFQNVGNLGYGVIRLTAQLGFGSNITVTKISHVTELEGGGPVPVPEPGTIALFGFGLLGVAWASRKRLTA
jgi:hypothetical protein